MRRYWILCFAAAILCVSYFLYNFISHDPDGPRATWPVLEEAKAAHVSGKTVVGPNIHVSNSFSQPSYFECVVAAHPIDPLKMIAAAMHWRQNDIDLATFYSLDGGTTWQLGQDFVAPNGKRFPDPTVVIARDGTAFLAHMQSDLSNAPLGGDEGGELHVRASSDGGKTWEVRSIVKKYVDRPWLAVDCTTGPLTGMLYCVGNIDEPTLYSSADGGKTLSKPLMPLDARKLVNCRPANPVVLPDGTLLIGYQDRYIKQRHRGGPKSWPRPRTEFFLSEDGGRTLNPSAPINSKWWHRSINSSPNSIAGVDFPQLAVDPGSGRFSGNVYCAWNDGNRDSTRIFFSRSPDGGNSWVKPVVISEQSMEARTETEYMSFIPAIAVNKDGVVGVTWYDRRGLPQTELVPIKDEQRAGVFDVVAEGWNVRFRASLDGGESWLPSVQLNSEPSNESIDVGHTAGLAATFDGRFHAMWIDNRTGTNQLWTAAVQVSPQK